MRTRIFLVLVGIVVGSLAGCATESDPESDPEPSAGEAAPPSVAIDGNAYGPAEVTVTLGDEVEWVNHDSSTHTVTADDASFDSQGLAEDDTFQHVFTEPGEYQYTCLIHPFMHGTVSVR